MKEGMAVAAVVVLFGVKIHRCIPPVEQINNQNRQNQRNHLDWTNRDQLISQTTPDHLQQGRHNKPEEQLCAKDNAKTVALEGAQPPSPGRRL